MSPKSYHHDQRETCTKQSECLGEMGRSSTFFCWLTLTDHTWLGSSLKSWEREAPTVLVGAAEASWTRGLVERHGGVYAIHGGENGSRWSA